jgi:hypothetical protein
MGTTQSQYTTWTVKGMVNFRICILRVVVPQDLRCPWENYNKQRLF